MAIWLGERGRKPTGGKMIVARKKRKFELSPVPLLTGMGKEKRVTYETKGGGRKIKLPMAEFANVFDVKAKTTKKVKITTVVENSANLHYVRRNIINKGSVINTELGRARVISRPGQDGVVNAILLDETKK